MPRCLQLHLQMHQDQLHTDALLPLHAGPSSIADSHFPSLQKRQAIPSILVLCFTTWNLWKKPLSLLSEGKKLQEQTEMLESPKKNVKG